MYGKKENQKKRVENMCALFVVFVFLILIWLNIVNIKRLFK